MSCAVVDCNNPGKLAGNGKRYFPRGYCNMHYLRLSRSGNVGELNSRRPGLSNHPLYSVWWGMVQRCHYPKSISYPSYGGRGITVCVRWRNSFENFLADMGEKPDGTTLDRIDNNRGYSPDNCKWSTPREQALNRRPKSKHKQGVRI